MIGHHGLRVGATKCYNGTQLVAGPDLRCQNSNAARFYHLGFTEGAIEVTDQNHSLFWVIGNRQAKPRT